MVLGQNCDFLLQYYIVGHSIGWESRLCKVAGAGLGMGQRLSSSSVGVRGELRREIGIQWRYLYCCCGSSRNAGKEHALPNNSGSV